jgi:hypothetical protein
VVEQTLEAVTEPELTSYWQGLNGSKAQLMSMNEFIGNEHKDLFPLNVNDVLVIFLVLSLPQAGTLPTFDIEGRIIERSKFQTSILEFWKWTSILDTLLRFNIDVLYFRH